MNLIKVPGLATIIVGKLRASIKKLLFLSTAGSLAVVAIAIGAHAFFDFSESSAFCGETCHKPMYPEYTTYQVSPHSNVECSKCHVGAGTVNFIRSKINGIPQITQTLSGNYPNPIPAPVDKLRPVMETCETCHAPQKFSGDLLRTVVTYKPDLANTKESYALVLKVGGGGSDNTNGIHWHIVSKVWYLPMDEGHYEIGWVGVERLEGGIDDYVNPKYVNNISPEIIRTEKRQMDCLDCHNRVTHIFNSPGDLIDKAIRDGSIDQNLPYIKAKGVQALDPQNPSLEIANQKIDAIRTYYQTTYPGIYASSKQTIDKSISKLKDIARLTTFPDNNVDWKTYADFSGHNKPDDKLLEGLDINFNNWKDDKSEGCFRCHGTLVPAVKNKTALQMGLGATSTYSQLMTTDNQSLVTDNKTKSVVSTNASADSKTATSIPRLKDTIDISCNVCHYSPANKSTSPLPKDVKHPTEKLSDCMVCHGTTAPAAMPDDHPWSTNEACIACHKVVPGTLPATEPSKLSEKETPHTTKGLEDCLICHNNSGVKPIADDHPWTTNETCSACHKLAGTLKPLPPSDKAVGFATAISHPVGGLEDCLLCHGSTSAKPVPADHPWATNETCLVCHNAPNASIPLPVSGPNKAIAVPHSTQGLDDCRSCHATGVAPSTSSHANIPNEMCLLCHAASNVTIPPSNVVNAVSIPHSTSGLEDCLLCHSSTGIRPNPSNHDGRTVSMCQVCHKPATTSQTLAVTTGSASSITATSATLSGNLNNLGGASSVSVSIQWGTTTGSYSYETTPQNLSATGAFQSPVTGLTAGTRYYFRAKAIAGNSTAYGAENSFLTLSPGGGSAPTVITGSVTGITANSATLNGNLTSLGSATSVAVSFQWGTSSGTYPNETPVTTLGTVAPFQANLNGLSAGTTYYFRAKAIGSTTAYSPESSFVTGQAGTPPSVATGGAINVTPTSATLQGNFTNLGTAQVANVSFQWGTTSGSYTNETPPSTMGITAPFQANITGLSLGTMYYYRAKAVGDGVAYGSEMNFTAQSGGGSNQPVVTTNSAINVTTNSATLRGSLDNMGGLTYIDISFQWGTTPGPYTGQTPATTMGTTGIVQFNLTGLSSKTTYYFRVKGTGGTTTVYGSEISFTTQ